MSEDKLTTLYNWSEEMTKAGDAVKEKHEDDYKKIIEFVKTASTKERILAAQLIARFCKYFPAHEDVAFDAIVDLCESPDVDLRKHATLTMIAICRDCRHLVSKASDILIQLYQTNQPTEVNLINQSLTTLFNLDTSKFLQSFFTNFEDGTETIRGRALKFLSTKMHTLADTPLTKEVEEQLLAYSRKAMEDVTKDEFITFINILIKLKLAKTVTGQAMIVLVIKSQAELDKEFDINNTEALDKFFLCAKHSMPLFSQYNRASEYVNYICTKVLAHLTSLAKTGTDLKILQTLAEMSPYVHTDDSPALIDINKCIKSVYERLLEYIPLPADQPQAPAEGQTDNNNDNGKAEENIEKQEIVPTEETKTQSKSKEVDFQFTHIEYLIYTFHQLGRLQVEDFNELTASRDIRCRLQHLALGCSKYMDILSNQLRAVKKGEDFKSEENKLRSVALRTTKNISTIIKDLFRRPPTFKVGVLLSCKPLTSSSDDSSSEKKPQQNSQPKQQYRGQKGKYIQNYRNKRARYAR